MSVGIGYLDGPRLSRGFYAAADWVAASRDDLNRINVFPVPDGDTGTNFTLTLRAVADALRALGDASLSETAQTAARAALLGARGNSGMLIAHFLIGFAEGLQHRATARVREVAAAVRSGADALARAIDEPKEGTILTVARDAAYAAERSASRSADIGAFIRNLHQEAANVLARTPEMMAALKDAGVVDAGGKGFVRMIEGFVRVIDGDPILAAATPVDHDAVLPAAVADFNPERDFQYCTELLVRGPLLPPANDVRVAMHAFGGSIVVGVVGDILKIHVHTDTPDAVFTYAERWGAVTARKAEDMRAQHRRLVHVEQRQVAIVTDSSNDLPDDLLDRHRIIMVPLRVTFGNASFLDRIDLKAAEFYDRMRDSPVLPTTSQPAPAQFVRAFRTAREEANEVVGVFLGRELSGTLKSAQASVLAAGINGVHLVDSRSASLGVGLLALRGAELAEAGWGAEAIAAELRRVRDQSGFFLTVDSYDNLIRSGRVSKGKAWLGGLLDIKPILSVDDAGRLQPIDRVRGREQVIPRLLEHLKRRLTPRPKALRLGVVHAEAPEIADRVRVALEAAFEPREIVVGPATGVLGAHVGLGAWGVGYQIEDGTPEPRDG